MLHLIWLPVKFKQLLDTWWSDGLGGCLKVLETWFGTLLSPNSCWMLGDPTDQETSTGYFATWFAHRKVQTVVGCLMIWPLGMAVQALESSPVRHGSEWESKPDAGSGGGVCVKQQPLYVAMANDRLGVQWWQTMDMVYSAVLVTDKSCAWINQCWPKLISA